MKVSNDDRRDLRIGARLHYDASYRITAEGEVHFHGKMPNSNEEGWWLFAQSVEEALDRLRNRRE